MENESLDLTPAREQHHSPVAPEAQRLIIGIGASAGGLAAFKTFFTHMPADTGMAFVLVQHLAPQHQSMLVELLRPQTKMHIVEAVDGLAIVANFIYVIPPDATLIIEAGILRDKARADARASAANRFIFLRSC